MPRSARWQESMKPPVPFRLRKDFGWIFRKEVISVYGGNRVSQGATRNGVYGFEYYTYDTDTGVTIVQSNKDKSYNLDIGQHMDTTDGEKIRVILGGAKIDWLSIWSNDKVILEAMEGTENTIHGIGYSCQDDAQLTYHYRRRSAFYTERNRPGDCGKQKSDDHCRKFNGSDGK